MYRIFQCKLILYSFCIVFVSCSHGEKKVDPKDAARLDPMLVRETVVYEPGAEVGAVVPEISAPRLRATWVAEKIENGHLTEAHREWQIEGDVVILGTPGRRSPAPQPQRDRHEIQP